MATFLDVGLLKQFEIIFPLLLVFAVVYAVFSYSKFLGDNKAIHSIIAIAIAGLVLLSDAATKIINQIAPWFVIFTIFIIFMLVMIKTFGVTNAEIIEGIHGDYAWVMSIGVIVGIIILLYAIIDVNVWQADDAGEQIGEDVSSTDVGGTGRSAFFATLRHPSVLGLILILLIANFAIQKLTNSP